MYFTVAYRFIIKSLNMKPNEGVYFWQIMYYNKYMVKSLQVNTAVRKQVTMNHQNQTNLSFL